MDKRAMVLGLLWDVVLPTAVYYVARGFGLDVLPALAAGGAAALVRVVWVAAVRRRLDGLAALVGGSFALLLAVSLLTGDQRVLLARESVLTGAAGLLLLGSCAAGRPVLYTLGRKFTGQGDPRRWDTDPSLRRHIGVLSVVLGGGLLLESAIRVALVFLLPADVLPAVSTALHLGGIGLLVVFALWYRNRRRQAVAEVSNAR